MTGLFHSTQGRKDVTGQVDLADTGAVLSVVGEVLAECFPATDWSALHALGDLFDLLYRGEHPDYLGCEAGYHDAGHVRDVTLTYVRLLAGREMRWPEFTLGPRLALAGVAAAFLHDAGYLRRRGDRRVATGAAYTRCHVGRGARLARALLPTIGLADIAPLSARLIHFTNCAVRPSSLRIADADERAVGALLGTADLLSQLAEPDYLDRCYYHLYDEFAASGLAGPAKNSAPVAPLYRSREDLLQRTPQFIHNLAGPRLEVDFAGTYHYASVFFQGPNPYLDAIVANCEELARRTAAGGGMAAISA